MISIPVFSLDASEEGDWISIGVPKRLHLGTDGLFYIDGKSHGKCAGTKPNYFRMDMSKPHFKEFYSWMLYMAAQKKGLDCRVKSGCGSSEVWVEYCRGEF